MTFLFLDDVAKYPEHFEKDLKTDKITVLLKEKTAVAIVVPVENEELDDLIGAIKQAKSSLFANFIY